MTNAVSLQPIATIQSCYTEKFGIPRQPGLTRIPATIVMEAEFSQPEAFRELKSFSHIWVIFLFHQSQNQGWSPTVRPPRLGGNERVGVFASRSMFRPNPVGLSVVELVSIESTNNGIELKILGGDFLDQTPVLDIKPYLPYVDAIANARGGYANTTPEAKLKVEFKQKALDQLTRIDQAEHIMQTLTDTLQLDPRPAYQAQNNNREYAMRIYDYDVKWQVSGSTVFVTSIEHR
ncbi:MAG: tRNA (N6-threonylcarbamoyladenosine(37)-N6)-methyltransferase TrmO [Gammaproteobacteria bacterium]|nr:tRNA (N6-threonylcarbamoyladenosine(37)-N6)-methyltransferase TrmO [Gammaproteobacteria bacterium]